MIYHSLIIISKDQHVGEEQTDNKKREKKKSTLCNYKTL